MFTDDTFDDEIDDTIIDEDNNDETISQTFEKLMDILKAMEESSENEDEEQNEEEQKLFNDEITPVIRNAIMITLAKVIEGLTLTKEKNRINDSPAIYTIKSSDGKINLNINMDDEITDNFESFRAIVKFAFDAQDFVYESMDDEREIIENVTKFFNGFILNLKEEEKEVAERQEYSDDFLTPKFHDYYTNTRTELTTLLYDSGDLSENEYYTLICARYLMDNIIEETIFFSGSEMLDFLNATVLLTKAFPPFEDGQNELHKLCKYVYDNETVN